MTASILAAPFASNRPTTIGRALDALFRNEPVFAAAGFAMAALMAPTLIAAALDVRTLLDVNVWIKPLKFEAALAIYLVTLAWFAAWLPPGTTAKPWYRLYRGIVAASAAAEIAWIGAAALLGVPSHFNIESPLWATLYGVMGVLATTLTSAALVYGILIARPQGGRGLVPIVRAGLVQGLVLTFVATLVVAGTMSGSGAHFVGGNASDAEGFPVFGWARDGGDLRVAHFFATHAMHGVPLVALALSRAFGGADRRLVWVVSAAFAGLVAFTFVQALNGQPFLG